MTDDSSAAPVQGARFREVAIAIRALIPRLKDPDVKGELWRLVAQYEKLARYVETLSESALVAAGSGARTGAQSAPEHPHG